MYRSLTLLITIGVVVVLASGAMAGNDAIVFPKQGQDKEQTSMDKAYCEGWAKEETGVEPGYVKAKMEALREKTVTDDESKMGGLFKGVMKGAATGAVTGVVDRSIGSEIGSSAAKTAVIGGVLTHEKQVDRKKELEYRKDTYSYEDYKGEYERYMRAFSVCMDAKGYSVR